MGSSVPMDKYVDQLEKRILEQEKRLLAQEELIALLKEKLAAGSAIAGTSGAGDRRGPRIPEDRVISFVGSRKSDNIQSVVHTKYTAYFVSRVHPDVSAEALSGDLLSNVKELTSIRCTKMKTRHASYASFHVVIPADQCNLVETDGAWPEGSFVRIFSGRLLPNYISETFDSNTPVKVPEKQKKQGPKKTEQTSGKTPTLPSGAAGSVKSPSSGRLSSGSSPAGANISNASRTVRSAVSNGKSESGNVRGLRSGPKNI